MNRRSPIIILAVIMALLGQPPKARCQASKSLMGLHYTAGRLTSSSYDSLRRLLKTYSGLPLRDTIILQYAYNGNPYNSEWLLGDDEIIQQKVTAELQWLHQAQVTRQKITVLHLVEPGALADSLQKHNNLVNADVSSRIRNLLFGTRPCSNSVMILPDRQYIYLNDANGWAALQLTDQRIQYLLTQNIAAAPVRDSNRLADNESY